MVIRRYVNVFLVCTSVDGHVVEYKGECCELVKFILCPSLDHKKKKILTFLSSIKYEKFIVITSSTVSINLVTRV
jgi:hypothetical protein